MDRSPTARSRARSHAGDGPIVTWSMTRAVKRGHSSGASMRTMARPLTTSSNSFTAATGARNGAPVRADSSRATPTTERQSGRFGVISISRTWSSRPRCATRSTPSGASASTVRMPRSCSSPRPSSRSEHSIPWDSVPRIFALAIRRSPGSTAPGGAKAARTPTAAFGAPQTTLKRSRAVETRQSTSRWPWLSPSSRSIASISPTTTPRSSGVSGVTLATSTPALIRRSAACSAVRSRSTNSRIQRYGIFMVASDTRPGCAAGARLRVRVAPSCELAQEAQIVLEEETDVVDAVLEHGDALDAHPEGPTGDFFGIVADVPQHLRVDHARAEDLEPTGLLAHATAVATAQEADHVDFRRGLGE